MRKVMVLGGLVLLAACGGNPNVPPQVTWSYGAGNGDPVPNAATPRYSFANGLGQDMPVPAGQMPTVSRAYGADGTSGVMEQTAPASPNTNYASPAQGTQHPAIAPAQSSHL